MQHLSQIDDVDRVSERVHKLQYFRIDVQIVVILYIRIMVSN